MSGRWDNRIISFIIFFFFLVLWLNDMFSEWRLEVLDSRLVGLMSQYLVTALVPSGMSAIFILLLSLIRIHGNHWKQVFIVLQGIHVISPKAYVFFVLTLSLEMQRIKDKKVARNEDHICSACYVPGTRITYWSPHTHPALSPMK